MKQKLFKAIEIFFESLYFLIITYTLSSMAVSFNMRWWPWEAPCPQPASPAVWGLPGR